MDKKFFELKEQIFANIEYFSPEIIEYSDYLADHPELSGVEYVSSQKAASILKEHGFEVEYPFLNISTIFKASCRGSGEKKIAF